MASLSLLDVTFAYSGAPLLTGVDLRVDSGWSGIVGPNGSGKTTLLRLIAGELEPQRGTVATTPQSPRIAYCRQGVEEQSPEIAALATATDGMSRRWLGALQLNPDDLERWPTLSPGERKRWQVAAALSVAPDLLLLDEPTNHLDHDATQQLVHALRAFRGLGLVISHDRTLLNQLPQRIIRLRGGGLTVWKGSYDQAREEWRREDQQASDELRDARRHARETRAALGDLRRARDQAQRKISSRSRMKNQRDRDGRSMAAKKRARDGEASVARRVHVTRAKSERATAAVDQVSVHKPLGKSFFVDYASAPKPTLLRLRCDELRAGDRVLLRDVDVALQRNDRVHLAGPNGAGKTTLLTRLLETSEIPRLGCQAWCMVLVEPTHHLDLPAACSHSRVTDTEGFV